ncbi:MAG: hypothetical protein ACE5E7_06595 [Anaerolineae bacterium]
MMSRSETTTYHIYGRKAYPQPLAFVKSASEVEMNRLAEEQGEWLELVAFPETAVTHVIPRGKSDEHNE